MLQHLKSIRSERTRLDQLLTRQSVTVRRAVNDYVATLTSESMIRRVADTLQAQGSTAVLDLIDEHVISIADSVNRGFMGLGAAEIKGLHSVLGSAATSISFDPASPRAAALMSSSRLNFITNFTQQQKDVTRRALNNALDQGKGVREAARAFRDSVGLTEAQWSAVESYRSLLEAGSVDALDRALRDRRFDSSVETAAAGDTPLSPQQIDRMVERYRDRYIAYRADTIARTETLRVLNEARQEATQQVLEDTGIDPITVVRTWRATLDNRTRDTHANLDGQERGLNEPFESSSGALLMFPGDPDAPAEEVINCLLPGERIVAPDLLATLKGTYSGQAVAVETAAGRQFSVTAKHPVLTIAGWKSAELLDESDYLICHAVSEDWCPGHTSGYNNDHMPPLIEDVHQTGEAMFRVKVATKVDLHGDILEGEIDIVLQARCLRFGCHTTLAEHFRERSFGRMLSYGFDGGLDYPVGEGYLVTAPRSVGVRSERFSLLHRHVSEYAQLCLPSGTQLHTKAEQILSDNILVDFVARRQLLYGHAGFVEPDQVTRVRAYPFCGHVYSPQTLSGTYALANGIINHNCRCVVTIDIAGP